MTSCYFFDSYAFIELFLGNPNYESYRNADMVTTKMNLFEVYYSLIRRGQVEEADRFLERYTPYVVDFNKNHVRRAAWFRVERARKHFSMVDSIGYAVAVDFGIPFLTGDRQFANLANVEFVG